MNAKTLAGLLSLLGAFGYGLWRAVSLRWVGDDAFISFRYALNLVHGQGLVYNAGERVEGYTNFLWTCLIAGGMKSGFDPVGFSWVLSIGAYAATAAAFAWLSWKLYREYRPKAGWFFPVTALALLLHYDQQVWATGGLETSFLTFLLAGAFVVLVTAKRRRSYLLAGLLMTLAALTRPDALIMYIMGAVGILLQGKDIRARLALYLLPLLLVFVPYWLLRWDYYGYPFPNTYYAKSADQSYFVQGWRYLRIYVETYPVLLLFPLAAVTGIGVVLRKRRVSSFLDGPLARSIILSLLMTAAYTLYIVKVGGDFMFARFFIPLTPLIFFSLEVAWLILAKHTRWHLLGAFVLVALVLLRFDPFTDRQIIDGIADERRVYPRSMLEQNRHTGEFLKRVFAGTDARIGYYGTHAVLAYYSEAPYAIECETGLTDTVLAHQRSTERGRVGHEKTAPLWYLLDRKVNFLFKSYLPDQYISDRIRLIQFGDYQAYILTFQNALMDHLARFDDVSFRDARGIIDAYIRNIDDIGEDAVKNDYGLFKMYYFDLNDDPEREKHFLSQ